PNDGGDRAGAIATDGRRRGPAGAAPGGRPAQGDQGGPERQDGRCPRHGEGGGHRKGALDATGTEDSTRSQEEVKAGRTSPGKERKRRRAVTLWSCGGSTPLTFFGPRPGRRPDSISRHANCISYPGLSPEPL